MITLGSKLKKLTNAKVKNSKEKKSKTDRIEEKKSLAELDLLLADTNTLTVHDFDAKNILKAEKLSTKKSRKAKKKMEKEGLVLDEFKIDTSDERFKDLMTDHTFTIDPTNPQYVIFLFYVFF